MKIKDGLEAEYQEYVGRNDDPYGVGIVTFSERWADLMEDGLADGDADAIAFIAANAERTSHEADTEGITGFMYACAVSSLAHFWVYGEELRRWHNVATQIGNEGEKANESGGVLNPALLVLGGDEA